MAGRFAVVKTVGAGAAVIAADAGLRSAGAGETTIRGAQLAGAIITLILLHKVAKRFPSQEPPPESQTGVGGTPRVPAGGTSPAGEPPAPAPPATATDVASPPIVMPVAPGASGPPSRPAPHNTGTPGGSGARHPGQIARNRRRNGCARTWRPQSRSRLGTTTFGPARSGAILVTSGNSPLLSTRVARH